jgi:hypothetical protein
MQRKGVGNLLQITLLILFMNTQLSFSVRSLFPAIHGFLKIITHGGIK